MEQGPAFAVPDGPVQGVLVMFVPLVIMDLIARLVFSVIMGLVARVLMERELVLVALGGKILQVLFAAYALLVIMVPTVRPALIAALMELVIRESVSKKKEKRRKKKRTKQTINKITRI